MAQIDPTIDSQPVVKDRNAAWQEMAHQSYDTPDDVYANTKPASASQPDQPVYDTVKKVGVFSAFVKGTPNKIDSAQPYDPSYRPTMGETIASSLTDFVRSGVSVGAELWSPEYKEARKQIDNVRKTDPEFADQLESSTIGKKLSNTKLAIKGTAAVAEGLLTILPFFKVGRAALAAEEAATLGKMGKVGDVIGKSATLSKLYSGGLNGAIYGGLYGLHANDADFGEAVKGAALGGVFGAGLMGAGQSLAFIGKYGGNKAMQAFKLGGKALGGINDKLAEVLPAKLYSTIFSIDTTMKKYYGDIGKNFIDMFRGASRDATKDLGKIQLALIDHGLMEAPPGLGKAFKGVEYVGGDTQRMLTYNQILRGKGAYADPVARTAAIQSDPKLQFLDGLRKYYGATSQKEGIVDSLLDLDTYLPKHTPIVELSGKTRTALSTATTQAEREAIFAANDPMVKEMVDNSVLYEKNFKTLDDAYSAYYDYADVASGGSHTPMGDNKFLQKMVRDGEASTIEEARGKVIDDLKYRKKSLTPMASSLDFQRKVNLPWYDPNPSRVMPQYTFDASMRIEMAKKFGANDEKLHEMLGSIKGDLDRGIKADEAAKTFESFVRAVTGQVERTPGNEKASAFIRSLMVPKLAFAQVINLGQSLNTLLASDLGVTMHGLSSAFKSDTIRKAIERGVLTNSFIRQIFDYNSGGTKVAEKILKYSGFTFTEMFNRVVGSSAADMWGSKNLEKLLADYGLPSVKDGEQAGVMKMLADKEKMNQEALMGGIKVQGEFLDKFKQMFPEEDFTATAGNIGAAKKRLETLESSIGEKTAKLQKAKDLLEKELLAKSDPLTAAETEDLRTTIDALRAEINAGDGVNVGKAESAQPKTYTAEQQKMALDGVVQLKRAKLEDVIARLESKFDESRALGSMQRDVVTMHGEASKTEETLNNYIARVHEEIKNIDNAMVGLQNELSDKQSLLQGVIDSYGIAEKRARENNPAGLAYDQAFADKKKSVSDAIAKIQKEQPREYYALKELGIPVDDVIARGFMTPEEKALASQTFVEKTQFLGQPIDLPYFASTPTGKVLFQFKTFAYQQARFINKQMKDQLSRKDYGRFARNLFILSTVFPMTGEVLGDVRSLITQEKRPTKALDRYVADIFAAGTYGMFYDYFKAAESGNTAKTLLGAAPGDAISYIEQLAQAPGKIASGHGDTALKNFTKTLLQQTGVARPAVNIIFPSTQPGKSTFESLRDWSAGQ